MSQQQQMKNGVNVTRLMDTITAITADPALGRFEFRADNRWLDGGHNRSIIQSFYGAGQEDTTRTAPFVMDNDEPDVLLGKDRGANPVEYVLHALAGCLTTSVVYHAAARGIVIRSCETTLEGDLDLQGMLGLDESVRKGYQGIRVRMTIDSDATAEQLEQLTTFSPVFDIVSNPVPIELFVETVSATAEAA
jgi:uncharacterized OsmC-like protein